MTYIHNKHALANTMVSPETTSIPGNPAAPLTKGQNLINARIANAANVTWAVNPHSPMGAFTTDDSNDALNFWRSRFPSEELANLLRTETKTSQKVYQRRGKSFSSTMTLRQGSTLRANTTFHLQFFSIDLYDQILSIKITKIWPVKILNNRTYFVCFVRWLQPEC